MWERINRVKTMFPALKTFAPSLGREKTLGRLGERSRNGPPSFHACAND